LNISSEKGIAAGNAKFYNGNIKLFSGSFREKQEKQGGY